MQPIVNPEFWNQRYAEHATVYGSDPNAFFKKFIDQQKPGTILLPAEGEGRNAVYAAKKGWMVDAFDFSPVAMQKAMENADAQGVKINYIIQDIGSFRASKQYDAVALIYVHVEPPLREAFHREIVRSLKPGGFLILEAFSKEQLEHSSGGPKDPSLLYDAPGLCRDFQSLHILSCKQNDIQLDEGEFHRGKANVLRFTGQRL